MTFKKIRIVLVHTCVGGALCAATMGVGMAVTTLNCGAPINLDTELTI